MPTTGLAGCDLSPFLPGVVSLLFVMRLRQKEGVMADPGLSVWPGSLGSAGPRSFGPSLADVSWAARPAN